MSIRKLIDLKFGKHLKPFIAQIHLEGKIGEDNFQRFKRNMEYISQNPRVKGLVLTIDSPGGSIITAHMINQQVIKFIKISLISIESNQIFRYILLLRSRLKVLLISFWQMVGIRLSKIIGDEVIAEPSSLIGSIGARHKLWAFPKVLDKLGIKVINASSNEYLYN